MIERDRTAAREGALKDYIRGLSPGLLKEYLVDHLDGADPQEIERFVVMLHAQSAVPAREAS